MEMKTIISFLHLDETDVGREQCKNQQHHSVYPRSFPINIELLSQKSASFRNVVVCFHFTRVQTIYYPSLATTPKITQNHLQFEHFTLLLVVKSDIAEEADKVYLIKLEHLHNKVFLYMILGRYFIIFIHSVSS